MSLPNPIQCDSSFSRIYREDDLKDSCPAEYTTLSKEKCEVIDPSHVLGTDLVTFDELDPMNQVRLRVKVDKDDEKSSESNTKKPVLKCYNYQTLLQLALNSQRHFVEPTTRIQFTDSFRQQILQDPRRLSVDREGYIREVLIPKAEAGHLDSILQVAQLTGKEEWLKKAADLTGNADFYFKLFILKKDISFLLHAANQDHVTACLFYGYYLKNELELFRFMKVMKKPKEQNQNPESGAIGQMVQRLTYYLQKARNLATIQDIEVVITHLENRCISNRPYNYNDFPALDPYNSELFYWSHRFDQAKALQWYEHASLRKHDVTSSTISTSAIFTPFAHIPLTTLISGSEDTTVRVWNSNAGRCIREFKGHTDSVTSVCRVSCTMDLIASGSVDRTVRVWRISNGECVRVFTGHTCNVNSVCRVSDDLIVSGSNDRTVRLWRISTGECNQIFTGHTGPVTSVCSVSADLIVGGDSDGTIRVWSASTGTCIRVLTRPFESSFSEGVSSVCCVSDEVIASGYEERVICLWNIHTGECIRKWSGHELDVSSVCRVSANLITSVTNNDDSGSESSICVWDTVEEGCIEDFNTDFQSRIYIGIDVTEGRDSMLSVCRVSNNIIASGTGEGRILFWNIDTGKCIREIKGHRGSVNCVC